MGATVKLSLMGFKIIKGIDNSSLSSWLKDAAKANGTFKDGRVDYTHAVVAPIIMCTVVFKNKILLVKRGYGLADAEGYWSTINGFIDEDKPVSQIAAQELKEELGLKLNAKDVKIGASYTLQNPQGKRDYITFPCLYVLSTKPKIVLNEEHTDFAWINRKDLENYHILDDLPYAIDSALSL